MMLGLARGFTCSSRARSAREKTCLLHSLILNGMLYGVIYYYTFLAILVLK